MRYVKRKKPLKPSSYIILSELAEASRLFEIAIDRGGSLKAGAEEYEKISAAAEAKLDALALTDPGEATRIFAASSYFDEYIDPDRDVYLGQGIIVDKELLKELDTPEKREVYIRSVNEGQA